MRKGRGREETYAAVERIPDLVGGSIEGPIPKDNCLAIVNPPKDPDNSNVQLEGEGTGEDSGQVDRVTADQAPVSRSKIPN